MQAPPAEQPTNPEEDAAGNAILAGTNLPLNKFSVGAMLFVLFVFVFGPIALTKQLVDLVALVCFIPPLLLLAYINVAKPEHCPSVKQLLARFTIAFSFLFPLEMVGFFGIVILTILAYSIFVMWWMPTILTDFILLFLILGIFVGVGEVLKYVIKLRIDQWGKLANPRHYTFYACAVAVGLACAECYYFVLLERLGMDDDRKRQRRRDKADYRRKHGGDRLFTPAPTTMEDAFEPSYVNPFEFLLIIGVYLAVLFPIHIMGSYHVGLANAKRAVLDDPKVSVTRALLESWLARTMFLVAMIAPHGDHEKTALHWAISIIGSLVVFGVYMYRVRQYEASMPRSYLRQAGRMFGYGLLAAGADDEDDADDEGPPSVTTTNIQRGVPRNEAVIAVPVTDPRKQSDAASPNDFSNLKINVVNTGTTPSTQAPAQVRPAETHMSDDAIFGEFNRAGGQ